MPFINNKSKSIILQVISQTAISTESVVETDESENMDSIHMTLCISKKTVRVALTAKCIVSIKIVLQ